MVASHWQTDRISGLFFPAVEGASISLQQALTLKWSTGRKQEVSLYHSLEFQSVSSFIDFHFFI